MMLVVRGAAAVFAVLAMPLAPAALAQEYPTKPIRIIVGPGSPKAVVAKLNGEVMRALKQPTILQRFVDVGWEPAVENTPEWFADHIKREIAKWAKVVKETGAKVD